MWIRFKIFGAYPELVQGFSQKSLGSFNDADKNFPVNLKRIRKVISIPRDPIWLNQVHKNEVVVITSTPKQPPFEPPSDPQFDPQFDPQLEGVVPTGDALLTNIPNIPLMIKVADCQSLLLYDPVKKMIGAIHAGWRGLVANVIQKAIEKMKKQYGSETADLKIGISPSLGPCCSQFSDPHQELPKNLHGFITKKNHVDFWAITRAQLKSLGVAENHIELTETCTQCNPGNYFSHRRGESGRMAAVIMINHQRPKLKKR